MSFGHNISRQDGAVATVRKAMTLNKVLGIMLLPMVISGCGEDDGSYVIGDGTNNKAIEIVAFGFNTDKNQKVDYIERADIRMATGNTRITEKPLFGKDSTSNSKEVMEYLLADKFEFSSLGSTQLAANTNVDSALKYHLLWKDGNNNNTLRKDVQYRPINIAGQAGVGSNKAKGFTTILNKLPGTQNKTLVFPKGAQCYTNAHKVDRSYFEFDDTDVTNYRDLTAWRSAQYRQAKFANVNVGSNNTIAASILVEDPRDGYETQYRTFPGAVQYRGKVYEAVVNRAREWPENEDPNKALVYCENYNKIAADFIEAEIKRAYR